MIVPDDARLTAYAVDEVDSDTAAAIAQALSESEELRKTIAEIQAAGDLLSDALSVEPVPGLRPDQRRAIEALTTSRDSGGRERSPVWIPAFAAAASLAVAGLLLWPGRSRAPVVRTSTAAPSPLTNAVRENDVPSPTPTPSSSIERRQPRKSAHQPAPMPTVAPTSSQRDLAALVTVRGVVSDTSGAAIPGVTVVARSLATGSTRQVASNAQGEFRLDGLPSGDLVLSAELAGFKTSLLQGFAPASGSIVAWNPTLELGAVTETVMVAAEPAVAAVRQPSAPFRTEMYTYRTDNAFLEVAHYPLSTFAVDVDTASYSNVRRFLNEGELPPPDAVRIEEMINYFPYDNAAPRAKETFTVHSELAAAPWNGEHRLLRLCLKARDVPQADRPASNLVFLIDVSGSMDQPNKLPLVRRALSLLSERLNDRDRVAIVVYAGAAGLVLPPTSGEQRSVLLAAIERLEAGGSTNGGAGVQLAYDLASHNFIKGGVNRVILATDGDFNVGITDQGSLVRLIEEQAKTGVFLSVLGFGMHNYKDSTLEMLADKGNGNYAYVDTLNEARKALVEQINSTLVTVAKDVKIQVEFNPLKVRAYRLIGYENRLLRAEEFNDDKIDAGEVGAGHAVSALYELVPATREWSGSKTDPLTYQKPGTLLPAARSGELMRFKLRFKEPEEQKSRFQEWQLPDRQIRFEETSIDFRFAAAVASFGMILRDSPHKGSATIDSVASLAEGGRGQDTLGYRSEFVDLVKKAKRLMADRTQQEQQDPVP